MTGTRTHTHTHTQRGAHTHTHTHTHTLTHTQTYQRNKHTHTHIHTLAIGKSQFASPNPYTQTRASILRAADEQTHISASARHQSRADHSQSSEAERHRARAHEAGPTNRASRAREDWSGPSCPRRTKASFSTKRGIALEQRARHTATTQRRPGMHAPQGLRPSTRTLRQSPNYAR